MELLLGLGRHRARRLLVSWVCRIVGRSASAAGSSWSKAGVALLGEAVAGACGDSVWVSLFRLGRGVALGVRPSPGADRPAAAAADVVGPRRGTGLTFGYAVVPCVLSVWWSHSHGFAVRVSLAELAALVLLVACAGRISILVGPRSWYSPATPLLVFAGLVGGPLAGALVGAASEGLTTDRVWRHRLFGASRSSTEGFAAGVVGLLAGVGNGWIALRSAAALAAVLLLAQLARSLIILVRGIRPVGRALRVGATTDAVEAVLVLPLLVVFLTVQSSSPLITVLGLATLLAGFHFAGRAHTVQSRLLERERVVARTDSVTGARNRLAFEEALAREHARVVRGGRPAGLFLVDLDHFKHVNDAYGHAIGDQLLTDVVARLTAGLRGADVVARWGGDELIVLAPDLDGVAALERFGERLRAIVCDGVFVVGEACQVATTASVGGTLIDGGTPPVQALERADRAAYKAKSERNASVVDMPVTVPTALFLRTPLPVGQPAAVRAEHRRPGA
jgi:diguanylate cyclase (GGDEF)-like protein